MTDLSAYADFLVGIEPESERASSELMSDFESRVGAKLVEYCSVAREAAHDAKQFRVSMIAFTKFAGISRSHLYDHYPALAAHISVLLRELKRKRDGGTERIVSLRQKKLAAERIADRVVSPKMTNLISALGPTFEERRILVIKIQELRKKIEKLEMVIVKQQSLIKDASKEQTNKRRCIKCDLRSK